jgi:hypothetical protein
MKITVTFLLLLILPQAIQAQQKTILFEKEASDWEITGDAQWQFKKGALHGDASIGEGFVITKNTYQNFVLSLQFKPEKQVNSGVFVLCKEKEMSATDCHEINIWDLHPNQDNRTGAIVTKQNPKVKIETIGKWNTYEIRCEGETTTVRLNGQITAIHTGNPSKQGVIGLQVANEGKIAFRKIRLKAL